MRNSYPTAKDGIQKFFWWFTTLLGRPQIDLYDTQLFVANSFIFFFFVRLKIVGGSSRLRLYGD